MNNPYWPQSIVQPIMSMPMVTTPVVPQTIPQPIQQPAPQQSVSQPTPPQSTVQNMMAAVWTWKAVPDYQSMLKESVPFDGTPVLFMMQNESVFYVVSMENGRKMINGYSFQPLDNITQQEVVQSPEEQRFSKIEASMALIAEQLNRLVGVQNESNNENAETVQRSAIKEQ